MQNVLVIGAVCAFAAFVALVVRMVRIPKPLTAGTVPGSFPELSTMVIGQIAQSNKTGVTGAFSSVNFFTAPVQGWYLISWGVHIDVTDGAGTFTFTLTPQGAPAVPGVQANLATPVDGHGPAAPYFLPAGGTVNGAATVGSFGVTTVECWVFAQRVG